MAIALQERVTGQFNPADTKTLTLTGGTPATGDLLVVRFVSDAVVSATGWTRVDGGYSGGTTDTGVLARLGNGSVNSVTLTAAGDTVAVLDWWTGNVSTAIGDCVDQTDANTGASTAGPTGTTTQADELALFAYGDGGSSTLGTWTSSDSENADLPSPGGPGTEVSGGFYSRTLTATGTVSGSATESSGTAANRSGVVVTFKAAAGGQTVPLGQTTETETAQAVTVDKSVALGQSAETEASQPVAVDKTVVLVQTAETETAQTVTTRKFVALGQPVETETAQPMTVSTGGAQTIPLGQAVEGEASQAVTVDKTVALTRPAETETSQTVTARENVLLAQAGEVETAQGLTPLRVEALAQSTETETAQVVTVREFVHLGQATETEAAQPVGVGGTIIIPLGQAVEGETVNSFSVTKLETLSQAAETEAAQILAFLEVVALSQTIEAETAQAFTVAGQTGAPLGEDTITAIHRVAHTLTATRQNTTLTVLER